MRIGVDATCWSNRRGYGRFARALLTATLAVDHGNEYVFFTDQAADEFPLPQNVDVIRVKADVPTIQAAGANGRRSLGDMWAVSRTISARNLDLFFFPSVYSYVPLTGSTPELVAIHDVIPDLFPQMVFPTWRAKLFWRAKVHLALLRARRILTVSEFSRRKLCDVLGIRAERIRVVNEAGAPVFRRVPDLDPALLYERLGIAPGTRFVSYVGGFSPHKNLFLLVDVFGELAARAEFGDLRLVLAGDFQGDAFFSCYRELKQRVDAAGLQERVLFPGYMRDDDLLALLNFTTALALPSFCEGFGLPAVEAAACGAPVLVTTESPLPELLGDGAIALAPDDRSGWHDALARVLRDDALRARMSHAAQQAAAALSWENSARQLLEIFEEAPRVRA
ncbi:MAG: glycosyltransferase family 4 protein [Candidatus Acidiferrales bacterium]